MTIAAELVILKVSDIDNPDPVRPILPGQRQLVQIFAIGLVLIHW